MKSLMEGTIDKVLSKHSCVVDVRNVAFAHLAAIKVEAAANRRFALAHSSPSFQTYAQPVIDKYAPLGWPICTTMEDPDPEEYVSLINNTASKEVLGVEYIEFSKTMVDMADKMVELGIVSKDAAAK